MGCKGHTLILFQGVLIFKERVNGALECEWAGLIEDDRADQAPLRGKCHQNTHSLVLLPQGITETAQFKSNTLNLLHLSHDIVGRITVPSVNCLWSLVWSLIACLESGIIFNIHFIMQNLSKILLKLKLGNSKVPQTTS